MSSESDCAAVKATSATSNFEGKKSAELRTEEILREIETMGDGTDVTISPFKRDAAHR